MSVRLAPSPASMKTILVWLGVGLAVILAVAFGVGTSLPREHIAAREISLHQPPDAVWTVVSDPLASAQWRPNVGQIESLESESGRPRWREHYTNGDALTLEIVASDPPSRLITRVADPEAPFGGTWTLDIESTPAGCSVRITEQGFVDSAIFRFVARFIMGYKAGLDDYLTHLAARFGEKAEFAAD
ncbi:MAG: SRPBCC family protein [Nitrospirae bacterium]|nr:SRPBCC family protein [Nitrospirota bacterium]